MTSQVRLENLSKSYSHNNRVLNNINLDIQQGEFVALLGSSGCGKTTALRLIAGFLTPDEGKVIIGGKDVTFVPPNKRNTAMVFQSYALFPHMSVADNIGFGLKMHKVLAEEAQRRIEDILKATHLSQLADRHPRQLSGGQQQRVALARALVMHPDVLLLDEPLSNLDAKLRHEMRVEIRLLHERLGLTTVFVTHDQEEALTLADRIMVMNKGEIFQSGTPSEVFEHPRAYFVADFTAVRNFFRGSFSNKAFVTNSGLTIACANDNPAAEMIGIRPNKIFIDPPRTGEFSNRFSTRLKITTYLGSTIELLLVINDGEEVVVEMPATVFEEKGYRRGDMLEIGWRERDMLYLEA